MMDIMISIQSLYKLRDILCFFIKCLIYFTICDYEHSLIFISYRGACFFSILFMLVIQSQKCMFALSNFFFKLQGVPVLISNAIFFVLFTRFLQTIFLKTNNVSNVSIVISKEFINI